MPTGFEEGWVPGDERGVAGARGDITFFCGSRVAGGLLGWPDRGDGDRVIGFDVATIGDTRAWAGGGGETDGMGMGIVIGRLGAVAATALEPWLGPFGDTRAKGIGCTWVWGRE